MTDDFIYDASLVSEDIWLDFWRLNGGLVITIRRPNPSGGDPAMMDPPDQNPALINGVRALVYEIDESDIRTAAGRLRIGDKKFETIEEVRYGDEILFDAGSFEVFRIDVITIGEMKIYSTKAHRVG